MNDPEPSDDLSVVLRKNLVRLGLSLVAIAGITALLVHQYKEQIDALSGYVFEHFGIVGVTLALFITDSFISPLPPDSLLILIANSSYHSSWLVLIPSLGGVSAVAGYLGYAMGLLFSRTHLLDRMFRRTRERSRDRILRFGSWAIALGALTPIPFSITCWTAGLMHLPFRYVWWPCLLRIPRYVLYYVAIAFVPELLLR